MKKSSIEERQSNIDLVMSKLYPNFKYETLVVEHKDGVGFMVNITNIRAVSLDNKYSYFIEDNDKRVYVDNDFGYKLKRDIRNFANEGVIIFLK